MPLVLLGVFSAFRYCCFETWKIQCISLNYGKQWIFSLCFLPWRVDTASLLILCSAPNLVWTQETAVLCTWSPARCAVKEKKSSYMLFLLPWAHVKGRELYQRAAASPPHLQLSAVGNSAILRLAQFGMSCSLCCSKGQTEQFFCWRKVCNCCTQWWLCVLWWLCTSHPLSLSTCFLKVASAQRV